MPALVTDHLKYYNQYQKKPKVSIGITPIFALNQLIKKKKKIMMVMLKYFTEFILLFLL